MKASETSERYAGKLRECCNYAARSAKNFAAGENNKSRQACGKDEKVLAETLKKDLSSFCDSVSEDTFSVNQKAYIFSNLLIFIFMLLSAAAAICSFFIDDMLLIVATVFSVLSLLAFSGVFGGTSKNVEGINIFAARAPEKDVKHRIILEANLDAPFKRALSPKTSAILKMINFFSIIIYIIFDIVELLITYKKISFGGSDVFVYISFPLAIFAFIPLFIARSVNASASFPGVVDNLVGCYTACGALRYMSEMDLRLKNTELCVLLTGAKNADLKGAKEYCRLHKEADKAVDTVILSIDTVFNAETLAVVSKSGKATDLVAKASENAGVNISSTVPKKIIKTGSGRIFKKNHIPCATLTTLGETVPEYLGTAKDTEENINVKAIEAVMKITLEAAYAKDSE